MVEVEFIGGCLDGKVKSYPSLPRFITVPRKFLGIIPLKSHQYMVGTTDDGVNIGMIYGMAVTHKMTRRQ